MKRRVSGTIIAAAAALFLVSAGAVAARNTGRLIFTAVMNGGQVVPPSISNALGVAYLTFDPVTKRLCYSISYSGLQGEETEAHIHAGASGDTNAVLFDVTPLGSPKMGCVGPFTRQQEQLLTRGEMYINIHSDRFPAGELRGQILPARGVRAPATSVK